MKTGDQWSPLQWIFNFTVGATIGRPSLFSVVVYFWDIEGAVPYHKIFICTVGAIHSSPVFCLWYAFVFSGCRGRHPLQEIFIYTVGAKRLLAISWPLAAFHLVARLCLRYAFVFGMPRTSSPTRNFHMHRRGDSRIARFLFAVCVRFREAKRLPYKETHTFCRDQRPRRSASMAKQLS